MIDVDGLLAKGLASRCRVGIGLVGSQYDMLRRRLESMKCGVEVVSFDSGARLVLSLAKGDVDAAVRGVMSSSEVLEELKRAFSLKEVMRAAVLEDSAGRMFLLAPVGIDEGRNIRSRIRIAKATADYFSAAGWTLKVGVLSKGRSSDASRGKEIRDSLSDGERIVGELRRAGIESEHHEILIEDAVGKCDLVLAPDGISGNLIFRTLHFVGSGKAFGAPVVNIDRVFVDTSRAKADFADPVLLAAGLAEVRKRQGKRA